MDQLYVRIEDAALYAKVTQEGEEKYTDQAGTLQLYEYDDEYYVLTISLAGFVDIRLAPGTDDFIDYHYEDVYEKYADLNPEEIHSDWLLEDASENLDEFVRSYMEDEYISYIVKEVNREGSR